jgi:hypothetical protein
MVVQEQVCGMMSESIKLDGGILKAEGAGADGYITIPELMVVAFGRCGIVIFEAFIFH